LAAGIDKEHLHEFAVVNGLLNRIHIKGPTVLGSHDRAVLPNQLIAGITLVPINSDEVMPTGTVLRLHDDQQVPQSEHNIWNGKRHARPKPEITNRYSARWRFPGGHFQPPSKDVPTIY